MTQTLGHVQKICGGIPKAWDPTVVYHRVCTDSRGVQPGDLYLALKGDQFDGNQFAKSALEAGAVAVVMDDSDMSAVPALIVNDGRTALGQLGAAQRAACEPVMFAVAGSNGKTSTKDMLAAVLRTRMETLHSEASFNNEIGVPKTLLQLTDNHRAAVLELGTNHPGELAPLIKMARPQYGLLTGIGREHLEFFGDLQGVAQEEGMLAELLPHSGKLFLYGDGVWAKPIADRSHAPVVTVGFEPENDWVVESVNLTPGFTQFQLRTPGNGVADFRMPLLGRHQAGNAALAIAAACELGMSLEEIAQGLMNTPQPRLRMQRRDRGGVLWLNDAYNANADSVQAALSTLENLPVTGRRFVVLGDMSELGRHTAAAHAEAGVEAATVADGLVALGEHAEVTAQAAQGAGLDVVELVADAAGAAECLKEWLQPGDAVLLKASRAARLEEVEELI